MSRGLWFVAGTAAGVYATTKARRAAEALTVDGIHDRLSGWFAGARVIRDEVRAGFVEKEHDLRARLSDLNNAEQEQAALSSTATPDNVRSLPTRHLTLTDSPSTPGTPPTPGRTGQPEQRRDHH